MSRVWLPIIIVIILILNNVTLNNSLEENELNTLEKNSEVIMQYGHNNSSSFTFEFDVAPSTTDSIVVSQVAMDTINQGYIFSGYIVEDHTILVDGNYVAVQKCDLYVAKADMNQNILWYTRITNQTTPNGDGTCSNDNDNNGANGVLAGRFISEILISSKGEIYVFGTVCHQHYSNPCITFGTENRGIRVFAAKYNTTNGLEQFNKTFLNQAGALVHVYTDGSIRLNHGGTEMGQGLFVKVAQVVSECFQVPLSKVHITTTNTSEVPNTSATAASSGSDINGMAAWKAATTIKNRMTSHAAKLFNVSVGNIEFRNGLILSGNKNISFEELAFSCWENRISLSSTGFYKTPKISWDQEKFRGKPYFYYTWGAAVSEAIIDIQTGESRILQADIVQDCGQSLNPIIDKGQIEGGFVQGLGWLTCEELYFNQKGKLMTLGPSTYKIPGSRDVPPKFNIKLLDKSPNEETTIFRSKAVGEPPLLLSISHFLALKNAISMASENANADLLSAPATPSKILASITNNYSK